jgi:hypothetical protein
MIDRNFTFATNGTVTANDLHNLIDSATIYQDLITGQLPITSVGTNYELLIADGTNPNAAPNAVTVYDLFEDALTAGTYTNANISAALTYGTATGTRLISTNATITTGTITTGVIPTLTSSTATFGTTTSTAATITSGTITNLVSTTGTIATLNSTTGTIATLVASAGTFAGSLVNVTTGTIGTLNSTTGTIGNLSTTLAGDFTISNGTGTLGTTGVTAGTYGTSTIIPQITVDAKGRVTSMGTSALGSTGKIGQIISTTVSTSGFTSTSSSFVDVTGLSVTITPTSSSSRIFVIYTVFGSCNNHSAIRLVRDSTPINVGVAAGNRVASSGASFGLGSGSGASGDDAVTISGNFLDSPSTTSSVTYKIQAASYVATIWYLNTSIGDGDNTFTYRGASTITVMEILP